MEIIDLITPPQSPKLMPPPDGRGRTRVTFNREERKYLGYGYKHPQLLKISRQGFCSMLAKKKWMKQYGPYFHRIVEIEEIEAEEAEKQKKDLNNAEKVAEKRKKELNKARKTILKRLNQSRH